MSHVIFTVNTDESSNNVIDWLTYYNESFIRINGEDLSHFNDDFCSSIKKEKVYESIWHWKGVALVRNNICNNADLTNEKFNESIDVLNSYCHSERVAIHRFFYEKLRAKKELGYSNRHGNEINKLVVLQHAIDLGIDVPRTILTNKKKYVIKFLNSNPTGIINKSIDIGFIIRMKEEDTIRSYKNYTEELTQKKIEALPDNFETSLFQEKLDKEFEIRSFYLDGSFYSMAIFSQNNQKTSIDFRKYDKEIPNRTVPFKLPENIEKKYDALMKELGLNTGSLDIVKTKDGRYVFLEVNPSGQFGMTSHPCNYNLNKKIAEFLINKNGK